jgi:curli biogenesis system outer membrane secretion channel CsgG
MTKQIVAALAAGITLFSASAGMAQQKPMSHSMMHKPTGKMAAAKTVYVCKDCKASYSAAQAKKMGYKDGMGHKLTKMSKAPAGYMDGSKMKM